MKKRRVNWPLGDPDFTAGEVETADGLLVTRRNHALVYRAIDHTNRIGFGGRSDIERCFRKLRQRLASQFFAFGEFRNVFFQHLQSFSAMTASVIISSYCRNIAASFRNPAPRR
jgi:hypothetical protein